MTRQEVKQYLDQQGIDWHEPMGWKEKARHAEALGSTVHAFHAAFKLLPRTGPETPTNGKHAPAPEPAAAPAAQAAAPAHPDYRHETLLRLAQGIAVAVLNAGVKNVEPEELRVPLHDLVLVALSLADRDPQGVR